MSEKSKNTSREEIEYKERLLSLLKYSSDAIDYWFDMCETSDENRAENDHFKEECKYFIDKVEKQVEDLKEKL